MIHSEATSRAPADHADDDTILPFEVAARGLRGRVVRLGPALDDILGRHGYPAPISKLLGEAIVLTVLLGSSLKFDGRFILQTKTDGPVRMIVVDYRSPGKIRACAQFDAAALGSLAASHSSPASGGGKGGGTPAGEPFGHRHPAIASHPGPDLR